MCDEFIEKTEAVSTKTIPTNSTSINFYILLVLLLNNIP